MMNDRCAEYVSSLSSGRCIKSFCSRDWALTVTKRSDSIHWSFCLVFEQPSAISYLFTVQLSQAGKGMSSTRGDLTALLSESNVTQDLPVSRIKLTRS